MTSRPVGLGRVGTRFVVLLLALLGCVTADAGGDFEVRVLLYEGPGPVSISQAPGPSDSIRSVRLDPPGRLVVDGKGAVSSWDPQGSGPWQVGERRFRGQISVHAQSKRIEVVNRVPLEQYVASIVGGEMLPGWPREALRAQAVAARTYLLHEASRREHEEWHVRATAESQVYRGLQTETSETVAAARSTRGEILTHRSQPILAAFHSTAGGRTASAGEVWGEDRPYLRVLDVEDESDAPHTYWRTELDRAALEQVLTLGGVRVGRLETLEVVERTQSGRVHRLRVTGTTGQEATLTGRRMRALFGGLSLRSTLFEVRPTRRGFAFVGSGHGHGVGMSQWGARAMAERGASYERILETFYPGARLERWEAARVALFTDTHSRLGSDERMREIAPLESTASIRNASGRAGGSPGSQGDGR